MEESATKFPDFDILLLMKVCDDADAGFRSRQCDRFAGLCFVRGSISDKVRSYGSGMRIFSPSHIGAQAVIDVK